MIFPKKPEILYAPMLATFGGGSANGFRSSGGAAEPYPFVFTVQGTVKQNSGSFQSNSNNGVSGFHGYEYPNLSPTISGNASGYVSTATANQNGSMRYGRMQLSAADCATLGVQKIHVRGCRGGNHNSQYAGSNPGLVNGGKGSDVEVEMDFPAIYSAYKWGGQLHLYFMGGMRGCDISTGSASQSFPATGGGGATVVAAYDGADFYPMVVAGGGGGAYHTDSAFPAQRPGLDAFLPSSNLTTYQVYSHYPHQGGTYPNNNNIGSTDRPWSRHNDGTGAGSGTSWLYKSISYSYSQNSYHCEIPPLRDYMMSIFGSVSPIWNTNNPTGNDSHGNGIIYGGFGGGGGGAYGGGGGAGYFGGWAGDYNGYSGALTNNSGRARGGQSYYNSTYCTLVSHAGTTTPLGQVYILA